MLQRLQAYDKVKGEGKVESSRASQILWAIWYAFLAGLSLALFSSLDSMIKYIFSLLTVYIGIRYFRRSETTGMRIFFVVLAVILYFLITIIMATIVYIMNNPDFFANPVNNS